MNPSGSDVAFAFRFCPSIKDPLDEALGNTVLQMEIGKENLVKKIRTRNGITFS